MALSEDSFIGSSSFKRFPCPSAFETARSVKVFITVIILLKSWDIPAVRVPIAAIFCECMSWASTLLLSLSSFLQWVLSMLISSTRGVPSLSEKGRSKT